MALPEWRVIEETVTKNEVPGFFSEVSPGMVAMEVALAHGTPWGQTTNVKNLILRGLSTVVLPFYWDYKQLRAALNDYLTRVTNWLQGDDARIRKLEQELKDARAESTRLRDRVAKLEETVYGLFGNMDDPSFPDSERIQRAQRRAARTRSPSPAPVFFP